jgi:hypothetical protein
MPMIIPTMAAEVGRTSSDVGTVRAMVRRAGTVAEVSGSSLLWDDVGVEESDMVSSR